MSSDGAAAPPLQEEPDEVVKSKSMDLRQQWQLNNSSDVYSPPSDR